ncbi:methylglyoxal reductase, acetol producing [Vibrio ishigakensis]|uniref:Methylglyoxal reductase, acetol producing n=1 Tax=Vibrio ishigakensis TaxID=1481914 RepID=A0A0B8P6K7_9VIBR|nr:methylglyoxal reductase, acetol producing [Vibrio ishigakensis]
MKTMPYLGAGTFRLKEQAAYDSVMMALKAGYRHIDTAQIYGNEAEVGNAMVDSNVPRKEIFLTTKVWMDKFSKETFLPSVHEA